ncbi:MAG: Wzz/FepE/Etk N-terminal domain-containing protein [Pseudomonadota bacterium]
MKGRGKTAPAGHAAKNLEKPDECEEIMNQGTKNISEPFGAPPPYEGDDISLRDLMQVLWRRRWWIVLCFGPVVLTGGAWTLDSRPTYQADATLEIKRTGGQSLSLENLFADELGPGVEKEVLTEVEILRGRSVAERAALQTGIQVRLDKSKRIYEKVVQRFLGTKMSQDLPLTEAALRAPPDPLHAEALKVPDLSLPLQFDLVFLEGGNSR